MMNSSPTGPIAPIAPAATAEEAPLGRLAGWCFDHRRLVLALWLVGVVGMIAISQLAGTAFSDSFSSGRSASEQVQDILAARFPQTAGTTADVVIHTSGPVRSPASEATTAAMVGTLRTLPHVTSVTSPFTPQGAHQVSHDGHIAFAVVQFDESQADVPKSAVSAVVDKARSFARPGYEVAVGGPVVSKVVSPSPGSSEGIGILAAMIIMLLAFGSVVAMGLPIITALFGIAIGFAVLDLFSHVLTVPIFAPEMLAMIGLGVGIDYALFIVTRYRQGLAEGRDPRRAVMLALATSGRAVLFAGSTVVISLVGLFVLQLPFLQGLAVGTIAAVVLVMIAALTVLPS